LIHQKRISSSRLLKKVFGLLPIRGVKIMSVTASIEVYGRFREPDHSRSFVNYLKERKAEVQADGIIRVNIDTGDGWEYSEIMVNKNDPFEVIYSNLLSGAIVGVYATFIVDGSQQYVFIAATAEKITIIIEGNRRTLDGYHTDYSWYFVHLLSFLCAERFLTSEISYRDAY
jgi:hypothetical protein